MWYNHFATLINSVGNDSDRFEFNNKIHSLVNKNAVQKKSSFTVNDVITVLHSQQENKSPGSNVLFMESIMHGGLRLAVHLCFLFTLFV
jgi:hypothetical protein